MNLNIKEINNTVSRIEDVVYKAEKYLIKQYESMSANGDIAEIELMLGDIAEVVSDKATSLTLILNKLEELQDYEQEHVLTAQFKNVKPTEI